MLPPNKLDFPLTHPVWQEPYAASAAAGPPATVDAMNIRHTMRADSIDMKNFMVVILVERALRLEDAGEPVC